MLQASFFGPKPVVTEPTMHVSEPRASEIQVFLGYVISERLLGTQLFLTLQETGSTRLAHF